MTYRYISIFLSCFFVGIYSPAYSDTQHHDSTLKNNIQIGDFYQGGVVFYIENDAVPRRGLIVALSDADYSLSPSCQPSIFPYGSLYGTCLWGTNHNATGALSTELFSGFNNTRLLLNLNASPTGFPAAYIAHQYSTIYDPTDAYWYLPSQNELIQLWNVVDQVNETIVKYHGRIIPTDFNPNPMDQVKYPYWSSTEVYFLTASAWAVFFVSGFVDSYYFKDFTEFAVRPVRTFTY